MSDDKREKLREYLRNNRPKNSVNLGNNSNNKEKSNENLEKDFNLDSSNLDNSQISNNKTNSNKRDYDKEPIVIKDNNLNLFFASSITCIFLVFLTWGYFKHSQSFLYTSIIAMISGIAYFREYFESANTRFIYLNNSSIVYLNPRREIKLKNIKKVRRTFSIKYDRYGGILYNKIAVIFISLSLFIIFFHSLLFKGLKEMFFILFGFCFCIFMPKFLLYLKNGGLIFKYKLFDAVVISDENTFINILPNDEMERNLLKRYFLDIKKINIENSKITFFII